MGRLFGEHPVVHLVRTQAHTEIVLEVALALPFVEHLLGLEIADELLHIVVGALATEELAGGNVEERHAAGGLAEVDGTEEVVLLVVEHVVLHGHAGRDELGDATLHQLLGQLRVFQLVADGHPLAGAYELGQVGV